MILFQINVFILSPFILFVSDFRVYVTRKAGEEHHLHQIQTFIVVRALMRVGRKFLSEETSKLKLKNIKHQRAFWAIILLSGGHVLCDPPSADGRAAGGWSCSSFHHDYSSWIMLRCSTDLSFLRSVASCCSFGGFMAEKTQVGESHDEPADPHSVQLLRFEGLYCLFLLSFNFSLF